MDYDKHWGTRIGLSYGDFQFHALGMSRTKGVPTAPWETVFNSEGVESIDEHYYADLSYDRNLNASQNVFVKFNYDVYSFSGDYIYEDIEDGESYTYLSIEENKSRWFGGEFRFLWDTHVNNRLITGVEYQNSIRADHKEWDEFEVYFDGEFTYNVFSVFVQDEYQVNNNLSLTAGLCYDKYSERGDYTTPRLGVIYNPGESSTVKLLYGQAFRVPSLYEKFYNDNGYEFKENLSIQEEKITTTEIVLEHRISANLSGVFSVFNYQMDGLVDPLEDPEDFFFQFRNVGNVTANGFQGMLKARFDNGLDGYLNYSFQSTKDGDLDEKLTNSPRHLLKAGLNYPFYDMLTLGADLRYESERLTVYNTEIDPFLLTNLILTTRPFLNHFTVSAKVQNLFDTEYQTPGGFQHEQPGITQDDRNYKLRFQYHL